MPLQYKSDCDFLQKRSIRYRFGFRLLFNSDRLEILSSKCLIWALTVRALTESEYFWNTKSNAKALHTLPSSNENQMKTVVFSLKNVLKTSPNDHWVTFFKIRSFFFKCFYFPKVIKAFALFKILLLWVFVTVIFFRTILLSGFTDSWIHGFI